MARGENVSVRLNEEQREIAKDISMIASGRRNMSEGVRRALEIANAVTDEKLRAVDAFDSVLLDLFLNSEDFREVVSLWKLLRHDLTRVSKNNKKSVGKSE